MYPNLYYAFKDLFGVEWTGLKVVNTFGFFVAIAFIGGAAVLTAELKRREKLGQFTFTEETIEVGAPASATELFINFLLGFLFGYKIGGAFTVKGALDDTQAYITSSQGNLFIGILLGAFFCGLKWYEKNKQKLAKPEKRNIRIWPHDRVGDMVLFAAAFGFLGAKIFNSLETWDDFVKDPIGSLTSFSGLTFYGGLICATIAIAWFAKKKKMTIIHLADVFAPAMMIGYAMGRIGCQMAGDGDWGILNSSYICDAAGNVVPATMEQFKTALTTNHGFYIQQFGSLEAAQHLSVKAFAGLPQWMFAYNYPHNVISEGINFAGCNGQHCAYLPIPVFPTPFYEIVASFILFLVLWSIRKKIKVPGQLAGIYLIFNGTERFLVEKIRVNTTYHIGSFHPTQAEIISTLLIIGGIVLLAGSKKWFGKEVQG